MKPTIPLLLLILLVPLVSANAYLVTIEEGEIIDAKRTVVTDYQPPPSGDVLELLDENNEVLTSTRVPTTTLKEPEMTCFSEKEYRIQENGEEIQKTKMVYDESCAQLQTTTTQYAYLPYHPRGTKIPTEGVASTYSVQEYSNYCGNNRCDAEESWFTCRQDCTMPVEYTPSDEHTIGNDTVSGHYAVVYGDEECPEDQSCIQHRYNEEGEQITTINVVEGETVTVESDGCSMGFGTENTATGRGDDCHKNPGFDFLYNTVGSYTDCSDDIPLIDPNSGFANALSSACDAGGLAAELATGSQDITGDFTKKQVFVNALTEEMIIRDPETGSYFKLSKQANPQDESVLSPLDEEEDPRSHLMLTFGGRF